MTAVSKRNDKDDSVTDGIIVDGDEQQQEKEGEDDASVSSSLTLILDAKKLVNAEVNPPKSIVLIWILMTAELGFDLITTSIAFFSSVGRTKCCGHVVKMGPLPMTACVPFFFLIAAEIVFLGRAILLTLWPSIFEARRQMELLNDEYEDDDDDDNSVGFEVQIAVDDNAKEGEAKKDPTINSNNKNDKDDAKENDDEEKKHNSDNKSIEEKYKDELPEFVGVNKNERKRHHNRKRPSCWKRLCCCLLRWNARMLLAALNIMTLVNPFFGCVIAWILLYQSDKTEAFIVLGIEFLSIVLHFVSVRMEGGLRSWPSKLFHSISLLPFFVIVVVMLVYLREGGVCYSVQSQMFTFSGCEVCPESMEPPTSEGLCTYRDDSTNTTITYPLEGYVSGGFLKEFQQLGNSINSVWDIANVKDLISRGAQQDTYCGASSDVDYDDDFVEDPTVEAINFCFYEF